MPAPKSNRQKTPEARLLGLASFILSQPEPVTREQIYESFPDEYGGRADRAEKKFTRDKDALRRLGFNLETEPLDKGKVGYFIDARSSAMPSVEFTAEEAAVLWTAGAGTLRFSNHPLRDDLESALRKLLVATRGLPPRATATEELTVQGQADGPRSLATLTRAWENRKRVKLSYWRVATDEVVDREVDLYGWASRRGEWILVGYCHLRKAVRIFYLSRIRAVSVSRRRDPDYEVPGDFDIQRWSRQQVWDYDVHPPLQAVVRFRGSLAKLARQLLPAASVTTAEDGARVARVEVRNLRGLVRQAIAWGPEAELTEPEEGRRMARAILAAAGGVAP